MLELVEGVDFEFMQDDEYDRMVPKERKKAMRRKAREDAKLRREKERQRKQNEKMASKYADLTPELPMKSGAAPATDPTEQTAVTDTNQQTSANGGNVDLPQNQQNEGVMVTHPNVHTDIIPDEREDIPYIGRQVFTERKRGVGK